MDKTDQQRLEILRKISANNTNGSRVRPGQNGVGNPPPSAQSSANTQKKIIEPPKPGCNVCSRNKRS